MFSTEFEVKFFKGLIFYKLFSSPELKAQVSFTDSMLSVVRPSVYGKCKIPPFT
jgi:hypothetical protein